MEEDKNKLIAQQTQVIANLMKVVALQQNLVSKFVDALRLFMLDFAALSASMGQKAPDPPDFLKKLHLVKDDGGNEN